MGGFSMTSRELVFRTLEFQNFDKRAPRQLWALPWVSIHHPRELDALRRAFPDDIVEGLPIHLDQPVPSKGDPYAAGEYVDPWGCVFHNIQTGIIGEVKTPIVDPDDEDWSDLSRIHIPYEYLSFDIHEVNRLSAADSRFIIANALPRPFEQLQFIRGTQQLYIDFMVKPKGMLDFIDRMHAFYCEWMEKWARTDVDGLMFMDDWGAQQNLLISPALWRELFKPLYKDYIGIAHRRGKKAFMHSDGNILRILPDLIELGLDAINSQIFCMGVENLAPFKGKITFWGEMDRQHMLVESEPADIKRAVKRVRKTLWQDGGCIAQCEFSLGAKPENVWANFEAWEEETQGDMGAC